VVVSCSTVPGEYLLTGTSRGLSAGICASSVIGLDQAVTGALASAGRGPGAIGGNASASIPGAGMSNDGIWVSISPTLAGMYGRGLIKWTE
jgi:hypothetical protein